MALKISAQQALTSQGWREDVAITIDDRGRIAEISGDVSGADHQAAILLPALSNVHSHSFQRAMAGLAERRGRSAHDDFWTWREVMYRFLELLTPDDVEAIAAQVQMEMLEAGYAAQAEFHYLHHTPQGQLYDRIDELSQRHIDAALQTGIGYTHLPVLYMQGGLDRRPLEGGQKRFGCDLEQFGRLYSAISSASAKLPDDFALGVAPHSLRAVSRDGLGVAIDLARSGPIHIHAAEQDGEVREVQEALGARPVEWLLEHMPVDQHWCFIHATQMEPAECIGLAKSGAVAGLCPITEANLGDGIFDGSRFLENGGQIGIGSDSNVRISLSEELRALETSQRLRDRRRVVLTSEATPSNGRNLYERAAKGGAQAIGRDAGRIEVGAIADLTALDGSAPALVGLTGDATLDTWIFAADDSLVTDVWSAGRHNVAGGQHKHHDQIEARFTRTMIRLRQAL